MTTGPETIRLTKAEVEILRLIVSDHLESEIESEGCGVEAAKTILGKIKCTIPIEPDRARADMLAAVAAALLPFNITEDEYTGAANDLSDYYNPNGLDQSLTVVSRRSCEIAVRVLDVAHKAFTPADALAALQAERDAARREVVGIVMDIKDAYDDEEMGWLVAKALEAIAAAIKARIGEGGA